MRSMKSVRSKKGREEDGDEELDELCRIENHIIFWGILLILSSFYQVLVFESMLGFHILIFLIVVLELILLFGYRYIETNIHIEGVASTYDICSLINLFCFGPLFGLRDWKGTVGFFQKYGKKFTISYVAVIGLLFLAVLFEESTPGKVLLTVPSIGLSFLIPPIIGRTLRRIDAL